MLRSRVLAGLDRVRQQGKKLGRPKVSPKVENAIRTHLSTGNGILKVAALVGVGSGTVQRVKREMAEQLQEAAFDCRYELNVATIATCCGNQLMDHRVRDAAPSLSWRQPSREARAVTSGVAGRWSDRPRRRHDHSRV